MPADEPSHFIADIVGLVLIEEHSPALVMAKADVNMAALARPVRRPFRHEGRHPAVALRQHLCEGLEQCRLVRRPKRVIDAKRSLQHPRTGFGMEALNRHIHQGAGLKQVVIKLGIN